MNAVTTVPPRAPDQPGDSLASVLVTDALARRPTRRPDHAAEVAALHQLAHALGGAPDTLLRLLVEQALWLCDAGSSGISLLEPGPDGDADATFRWTALAGAFAGHEGGTTPRHFSPCGACLDQGRAVLLAHPERRFTYLQAVGIPLVEGLVLPFAVRGVPAGTVWVVSHRDARRFDLEDVRIMSALAAFTGAAYTLMCRPSPVDPPARPRG